MTALGGGTPAGFMTERETPKENADARLPALASRLINQSQSLKRVVLLLDHQAARSAGSLVPVTNCAAAHRRRTLCPAGFDCPHCDLQPPWPKSSGDG